MPWRMVITGWRSSSYPSTESYTTPVVNTGPDIPPKTRVYCDPV